MKPVNQTNALLAEASELIQAMRVSYDGSLEIEIHKWLVKRNEWFNKEYNPRWRNWYFIRVLRLWRMHITGKLSGIPFRLFPDDE